MQPFFSLGAVLVTALLSIFCFRSNPSLSKAEPEPRVEIRRTADGALAAFITNDPAFKNTVIALQATTPFSLTTPVVLVNSRVNQGKDCVTFSSRTSGENVVFKLASSTCSLPSSGNIGVYTGYGLIKENNAILHGAFASTGSTDPFPPVADFSCKCLANGSNDKACDSGGAGASGCATGSGVVGVNTQCEVSCNNGFFACCID